jgi:hypothetical protein
MPDSVERSPSQAESGHLPKLDVPDIQWTLDEAIAEGDRVAARYTMRGTHGGVYAPSLPASRTSCPAASGSAWRRRTSDAGVARALVAGH